MFSGNGDDTIRVEPDASIMAALDGRLPKPASSSRALRPWAGLGGVALLVGWVAWWWPGQGGEPSTAVLAQSASAPASRAITKPVGAAPATLAASATVARAVIEEAVSVEHGFVPTAGASVAASAAPVAGAQSVAGLTTNAVGAGTKSVAAKPAKPGVAAKADTANQNTKVDARPAPARGAETHVAEPAPHGAATKDADVELLAALMHYTDEVAAPGAGQAKAQATASRMNELTIADLVKRCKAQGGDEATECKKRICSGYWGKAEACPAKQAPKANKRKQQPA